MGKKQNRIIEASYIEKIKYREFIKNNDADNAIIELKKLYKRYPNDKSIIFDLASLYVAQDINFSEGSLLFELIRDERNTFAIDYEYGRYYLNKAMFDEAAVYFRRLLDGSRTIKCKGLINLVKIYSRIGYYGSALDCYEELTRISKECDFDVQYHSNALFYLLYMNGKLGLEKQEEYNASNYYARQVMNYNAEEVISHIKEDNSPNHANQIFLQGYSVINSDIDIAELYKTCEDAIQYIEPVGYSITGDYYLVPLGTIVGKSITKEYASSVEVFTLPNTKCILTMHPTTDKHINKRFEDFDTTKTKTLAPSNKKPKKDDEVPFIIEE
ncbi:MAG: hypothetical protein IKZ96_02550 [Bacilli bacterium]|nr:hypothetical protein [Bacilli bacterium]